MKNFQIVSNEQSPPCKDSNLMSDYKSCLHQNHESFPSPTYPHIQIHPCSYQSQPLGSLPLNLSAIQRPSHATLRSSASSECSENIQLVRMALRQKFGEVDSISVRSRNPFEESETQSIIANVNVEASSVPQNNCYQHLEGSKNFFFQGLPKVRDFDSPSVKITYPSEDSTTLNGYTEENGVAPLLALRERRENMGPSVSKFESKNDLHPMTETQFRNNKLGSGSVSDRHGRLEQKSKKENQISPQKVPKNADVLKISKKLEETLEENYRLADKLNTVESKYKEKVDMLVIKNQNLTAVLEDKLGQINLLKTELDDHHETSFKKLDERSGTNTQRSYKDTRLENHRYRSASQAQKDSHRAYQEQTPKLDRHLGADLFKDFEEENVQPEVIRAKMFVAQEEIHELNRNIQTKMRENDILKHRLIELEDLLREKKTDLDYTLNGLQEENESLQNELKTKNEENLQLKSQVKDKDDEIQRLIQQMNEIQSSSLIRASHSAELRSKYTTTMLENDKLTQANQRLLKENEILKSKLYEANMKNHQNTKPTQNHVSTQIDDNFINEKSKDNNLNQTVSMCTEELTKEKIVMLSLELFRLQLNLQEKTEKIAKLQEKIKKQDEKAEDTGQLYAKIDFMTSMVEKLQKDSSSYLEEFAKLQKKHNQLQEQVLDSTATHDDKIKAIIDTLIQDKDKLTNLLQEKLKELEESRVYSNRLNDRISTLLTENDRLSKALSERIDGSSFIRTEPTEVKHKQSLYVTRPQESVTLSRTMSSDFVQITPKIQNKDCAIGIEESLSPKVFRKSIAIPRSPEIDEQKFLFDSFQGKIDIVFCVDCTRSMSPYINILSQIYARINSRFSQEISYLSPDIRFGFVGYREHSPYNGNTWVTKVQDLDTFENCLEFIKCIETKPSPDNDFPEAVMPGLWDCVDKICWRNDQNGKTIRIIFHLGDAPPHGEQYYKGKFDHFPEGDPSGITIEKISQRLEESKVSYKLIKIGKYLDMMEKVFKENIKDIEVMRLNEPEQIEDLIFSSTINQFEKLNIQVSTKDKKFLSQKPRGLVRRTPKMGTCYSTSVIFDDYISSLSERNNKPPKVKAINLYSTSTSIVGIQFVYSTKDEEFEGPLHTSSIEGTKKTVLRFEASENLSELSININDKGNVCGMTILTSLNKLVKVGGKSVKKLECFLPGNNYTLVGFGGSYRKNAIDSLYFYYN